MGSPDYDKVIDALYADVLAPAGFGDSLLALAREFGTEASWVVVWDRLTDLIRVRGAAGIGPEFQAAYETHYQHSDPAKERFSQVPVGQWWIDSRELGIARIRASEFHQEFLRAHDMASYMGTPVFRSAQKEIALSFLKSRAAGLFTGDDARGMERLLTHVRNAVLLREHFLSLATTAQLSQQILERLPCGVAVMDCRLNTLLENFSGRSWLGALGSRRSWSQRLPGLSCSFAELIQRACSPESSTRPQAKLLQLPGHPVCYLVILALSPGHRFVRDAPGPAALVLFYMPGQRQRVMTRVLSDLFSLTPAECRLVREMGDGSGLQEAGDALRLRKETARSMLKSVFHKTGIHSQAQLLRMLTALSGVSGAEDPRDV